MESFLFNIKITYLHTLVMSSHNQQPPQNKDKGNMFGKRSHEADVNAPASQVWELYGGLKLAKFVEEKFEIISKIDLIEGDGGVGTVLKLSFTADTPPYSQKFTKIDNEKMVKETEVVEGGYLNLGFTLYRVRFEIIEKGENVSSVISTIEYELKEEAAANASTVSIKPLAAITELANEHFNAKKA